MPATSSPDFNQARPCFGVVVPNGANVTKSGDIPIDVCSPVFYRVPHQNTREHEWHT